MIDEEARRELYRKSFALSDADIEATMSDLCNLCAEELKKSAPDYDEVDRMQSHYALLAFVQDVRKKDPGLGQLKK